MIIKNPLIIKKAKLQAKIATPTTSSQTIVFDSNYDGLSSVEISAVDHTIDSNITAENIKKDITILGVTGTLESGGGDNKFFQLVERSITELTADDLDGATKIGDYVFYQYKTLTSITIPNSVTSIGQSAFAYCSGLTTITIPDSVTSIGNSAFHSCKGLTGSFTIPDSVTSVGGTAFSHCSGLTSVTIGNSVTGIGTQTFAYCSGLTSVTIGNSVTSIGSGAFYGPNKLTSITIPNSVKTIESAAFYSCNKLTEMTILATTPPKLSDTNAISSATTKIYIPAGTLSAYQSATNWSSFASKFVELSA